MYHVDQRVMSSRRSEVEQYWGPESYLEDCLV